MSQPWSFLRYCKEIFFSFTYSATKRCQHFVVVSWSSFHVDANIAGRFYLSLVLETAAAFLNTKNFNPNFSLAVFLPPQPHFNSVPRMKNVFDCSFFPPPHIFSILYEHKSTVLKIDFSATQFSTPAVGCVGDGGKNIAVRLAHEEKCRKQSEKLWATIMSNAPFSVLFFGISKHSLTSSLWPPNGESPQPFPSHGTSSTDLWHFQLFFRKKISFLLLPVTFSIKSFFPKHSTELFCSFFLRRMWSEKSFWASIRCGDVHVRVDFVYISQKRKLFNFSWSSVTLNRIGLLWRALHWSWTQKPFQVHCKRSRPGCGLIDSAFFVCLCFPTIRQTLLWRGSCLRWHNNCCRLITKTHVPCECVIPQYWACRTDSNEDDDDVYLFEEGRQ